MGNIFLFTLIIGIVSSLILLPIYKREKSSEKEDKQLKIGFLIASGDPVSTHYVFTSIILVILIGTYLHYGCLPLSLRQWEQY